MTTPPVRRFPWRTTMLVLATVVGLIAVPASWAAFPGTNGKIAFDSNRDGNEEIYVINPDGTGETRLTANAASDHKPAWSPDGSRIAFNSNRAGNFDVWVMNADGTGPVNLTNHPGSDSGPAWSPDGTRIAFLSDRNGGAEIFVMNADGTGQTPLTSGAAATSISWSPDGARMAFASLRDGFFAIYVMNADGTGMTRITHNPQGDLQPDWSPDGARLTFTHIQGGNAQVYVMNADGTGQTNLTSSASFDFSSSWSPDGTRIQFSTNRDGAHNVYVMNADGSGQTRVTVSGAADFRGDWGRAANRAPTASAGADQTVAAGPACTAAVALNGGGSSDPDADALTYTWTGAFGTASGATPTVVLAVGVHTIVLTVDDGRGGTATDTVVITVADVTPPAVTSVGVTPGTLWPPNHRMIPVTVSATATDNCGGAASCQIVAVASNEPVDGLGDGDTAPDWEITGPLTVKLRAERSGRGAGRVYTLTVRCVDGAGNSSLQTITVTVPHSQGKN